MKVVILAGGLGTRLSEETHAIPKPMIEIGGRPIIWHIMKHYAHHGFNEFVVPVGYRGDVVKRFFLDYYTVNSDFTVSLSDGSVAVKERPVEDWTVHIAATGLNTNTGGRLGRIREMLDGTFMVTYGDGVSNVEIDKILEFHKEHGRLVTMLAVRPPARFGELDFTEGPKVRLVEKPQLGSGWVNGGFMVMEPSALDAVEGDDSSLEVDVLEKLSAEGEVCGMRHEGFWQCMDTARDLRLLRELWDSGHAPWKSWT